MGNLRVGDLAEVELKKVSVRALKQSNEFQKMPEKEKEKVEALKLDCREKAIFDKIIKEGNAGRVS